MYDKEYVGNILSGKITLTSSAIELVIKENAQRYYDGESIIDDKEFDGLVELLRKMDPESNVIKSVGWGYNIKKASGTKVKHRYQLIGSLPKSKTIESIEDKFKNTIVVASAKLDGLSAVCYYISGTLVRAITRGNGEVGIDITDKLSVISPIKLNHPLSVFSGAIRGELVISNKSWGEIHKNNPDIKSQRNYASGIINRNEITDDLKYIEFIPYNFIGIEDSSYPQDTIQQTLILDMIKNAYGKVVPYDIIDITSIDDLRELYKSYGNMYPVDGVVITNIECSIDKDTDAVGYSQKAVKFESETSNSRVKYIDWKLSRIGRLIPTVVVDPIDLDGATIRRVSGFNAKYIIDNKIGVDAVVNIMRSGSVIPDIQEVVEESPMFSIPSKCPECGNELSMKGVDLVCTNNECCGKKFSSLMHWTAVIAPVDGLGGAIKEEFFDSKYISSIDDLYFLYGDKEIISDSNYTVTEKKLFEMLKKLINDPITSEDALVALNIPRLGRSSANDLSPMKDFLESLVFADNQPEYYRDELSKIVGNTTCDSILNNISYVRKYLKLIWNRITFNKKDDKNEVLESIAVTGSLSVKRSEFEKIANDNGYKLSGNLKDCKYLVTNNPDPTSSKGKAAKQYGVEIITEEEFMNLISK